MRHPHSEVAQGVLTALEHYRSAIGSDGLDLYADDDGAWWKRDEEGWDLILRKLHRPHRANIHLVDASADGHRYRFDYDGKRLGSPALVHEPGAVSAVAFWLPTEYLEEQGPVPGVGYSRSGETLLGHWHEGEDHLLGATGLRSRLSCPGTQVEEMEGGRAVVTRGASPEAGDTEAGQMLPGYRELAQVLEPWLYQETFLPGSAFSEEELRRWERRFLD
ncbi:type VI immunity family protein [Stigmatella aurantiaca]|uniref:Uncharacterized protein n=2 Tax=Stigmatella aurantiaca TaxID=41 RepID=Q099N3_STIAD|nr:type VI immunity family protein [Stigmatella aurantiaca]ADO75844.1 uncharacterized protein STAUR_8089 [Stigmatella aurantiaca DW4/3-1]EAU68403.1 hypothetical protein STIAU_3315 [Stigmatella aurantiaca DW4/3-1]